MTSREIAELTGKRHDNVMADTRKMLEELHGEDGLLTFQETYINEQNGQQYHMFALPERETLILISGYNLSMRAKIIDRWQELEAQVKKPMSQIEVLLASVQMLADVEKRQLELEQQQQEVQQSLAQQKSKLLQIDNKITTGLEEVKETNLLTSCPTAAESITGIRLRMNEEYGLSAAVVDAVELLMKLGLGHGVTADLIEANNAYNIKKHLEQMQLVRANTLAKLTEEEKQSLGF